MKSESEIAQSCPTLSDPMDCSLPGSSIHGMFQARYWSGVPLPSLGHKTMLILKLNPITGFMANYICLVLLGYLGGFPPFKALTGLPLGNLF